MKNKNRFGRILFAVLTFVLVLFGCPTDNNDGVWTLSTETINGEWSIAFEPPNERPNYVLTATYPNWNWKSGEDYLNKGTLSIDTTEKTITFTATYGGYAEHDGTLEDLRQLEKPWSVKHPYEEISEGKIKLGEKEGNLSGNSYFDDVVMTKR
jgi:hypothetical protein